MANVERARNYSLVTYHSEETVKAVIRANINRIRHWAYCIHDKDVKEDGTPQEVHIQIMLNLNYASTLLAVRRMFPGEVDGQKFNTLGQVVRDLDSCFEYLSHENQENKFHYPHDSVQCDNRAYWEKQISDDDNNKALLIISDILDGERLWVMLQRYGRDFVIHREQYYDFARLVREENISIRKAVQEVKKEPVQIELSENDKDPFTA